MSILNDILLRVKTDPNLTAKGSALTWDEEDTNFVVIYNELVRLGTPATGGFSPYNNGTTYSNVGPDYVSYDGNIYEFINAVPTAGVTPGSDPLFWEIASLGQFSHERNKDQYVDLGGDFEVSAEDIYNKVNETPIDVDSFFAQGGNSFTAAAVLGTNDLFDLLFRTDGDTRQLIDSTGRFGFGTTSLSASTHKTNKSQGNTSASWGEKWLDSDNAEIATLDNNGLFVAYGGLSTDGTASIFSDTSNNNFSVGVGALSGASVTYGNAFGTNVLSGASGTVLFMSGLNSGLSMVGDNGNGFGTSSCQSAIGDHLNAFGEQALKNNVASNVTGMGQFAAFGNTFSNVFTVSQITDVFWNNIGNITGTAMLQSVTMQSAMSVDGTNTSAAASIFKIAPARGTGNAAAGNVVIQRANIQASGTTRHTLSDGLIYEAQTGYTTASTSTSENVLLVGAYQSKSANYTALPTDETIECTANTFTVTLYTAVGYKGRDITINNQGAGVITVDGDGTETINGALTQTLNQYDSMILRSNGTNWIIIATY